MGLFVTLGGIALAAIGAVFVVSEAPTFLKGWAALRVPEASVGDIEDGTRVALRGDIATAGESFTTPLGETPYAVVSCWLVEALVDRTPSAVDDGMDRRWSDAAAGIDAVPFVLEDETGRALVRARGTTARSRGSAVGTGVEIDGRRCEFRQFRTEESVEEGRRKPRTVQRFRDEHTVPRLGRNICRRRYSEGAVAIGDTATVVGRVKPAPADTDADVVVETDQRGRLTVSDQTLDELATGYDTAKHLAIAGLLAVLGGGYLALNGLPV